MAAQVRHGKLVDGELVAGLDDESDDEDEDGLNENARRTIAELMGKSPEEKGPIDGLEAAGTSAASVSSSVC